MKIWLKLVIKTLLVLLASWLTLLIVSTIFSDVLFHYKLVEYRNELDTIFLKRAKINFDVKYKYRSGDRGTIYFASTGTTNLIIIDATNFKEILPINLQTEIIKEADLNDWKTYTNIFHEGFPVIQAVLNPRKSVYLRILLEEPFKVEYLERKSNHFYLSGKFRSIALSNSQHCYIISFSGDRQDLLVLNYNDKLYILIGEMKNETILEIINPLIL